MNPSNGHQITSQDLRELLTLFKDSDHRTEQIENTCIQLISKDYPNYVIITNPKNSELCNSYPSKLLIPEIQELTLPLTRSNTLTNEGSSPRNHVKPNGCSSSKRKLDAGKLKELMSKARVARCRTRFPMPAILYKNKYICRSATLSSGAEIYGRSVYDYTFNDRSYSTNAEYLKTTDDEKEGYVETNLESSPPMPTCSLKIGDTSQLFSQVRNLDIKLLKYFAVNHICDLMLEKKKVKYGMNVTSSEKADKENRYSDFNIISLPYPGCEFFREYRDNSYSGEGLIYEWEQDFVDADLHLPNCDEITKILRIKFQDYRKWDVIKLTQNYIKLLLYFLRESDSSILIHCISGWDRTPLFISLLRLTLWADGEIHKNLNAAEITYLTVAYDWFLFGHNLTDRLNKGEEIMFFCFQFLKFITTEDFSINYEFRKNFDEDNSDKERKISVDSYAASDDFVMESIPLNYRGSSFSLNSNCSLTSIDPPADEFSLLQTFEKVKINCEDNGSIGSDSCDLSHSEMMSTLTSSNGKLTSSPKGTHQEFANRKSPSKPMEIPKKHNSCSPNNSLCRSDSWQFVSDAGSIRDTSIGVHYSSPDSPHSIHRKSISPVIGIHQPVSSDAKLKKRKDKLLEVRSIFNSAYTTTTMSFNNNSNYNNGPLTNLVDHLVCRVYPSKDTE